MNRRGAFTGCLLGCAAGDSLGLPVEGFSPERIEGYFGRPARRGGPEGACGRLEGHGPRQPGPAGLRGGPGLRQSLFFGRGMCSDDTEHICMTAQALLAAACEPCPGSFARILSRKLRWWLAGLPAGTGFATLRAIMKMWLGFGPASSGVLSAGNGPCMRSPILGLWFSGDSESMRKFVEASTRLTHTDHRAFEGAMAVALATAASAKILSASPSVGGGSSNATGGDHGAPSGDIGSTRDDHNAPGGATGPKGGGFCPSCSLIDPGQFVEYLVASGSVSDSEFIGMLRLAVESVTAGHSTREFCASMGWDPGVSGYTLHTVTAVLHCWFRHQGDFRGAIEEIVLCGGDTDTTAAILGAIVGAGVGADGIPPEWIDGIMEWPRSVRWIRSLAERLWVTRCSGLKRNSRSAAGIAREHCQPGLDDPVPTGEMPLSIFGVLCRNMFFLAVVLCHGLGRLLRIW